MPPQIKTRNRRRKKKKAGLLLFPVSEMQKHNLPSLVHYLCLSIHSKGVSQSACLGRASVEVDGVRCRKVTSYASLAPESQLPESRHQTQSRNAVTHATQASNKKADYESHPRAPSPYRSVCDADAAVEWARAVPSDRYSTHHIIEAGTSICNPLGATAAHG